MAEGRKYLSRKNYAIKLALRVGRFVALTLGFPFITYGIVKVSGCGRVGGACGAVALLSGMYLKPLILVLFAGSLIRISFKRLRDAALPGLLCLFIPVLLLIDWQFATVFGAHWSVAFSLGGTMGPPYYMASALACMLFLCGVGSGDGTDRPLARFGVAGILALAVTVAILAMGVVRLRLTGMMLTGDVKSALMVMQRIASLSRLVPWAVLLQAVLFAWLIWRDFSRCGNMPR